MERLTVKRPDGRWAIAMMEHERPRDQLDKIPKVIDKLAAYENIGLEPEEVVRAIEESREILHHTYGPLHKKIGDWLQAEQEGRLVVVPCKELFEKIGDDVYVIDDGEVVEALLCLVGFDHTGKDCIEAVYGKSQEDERWYVLRFSDVGKTVFLTPEEVEAALRGGVADA